MTYQYQLIVLETSPNIEQAECGLFFKKDKNGSKDFWNYRKTHHYFTRGNKILPLQPDKLKTRRDVIAIQKFIKGIK